MANEPPARHLFQVLSGWHQQPWFKAAEVIVLVVTVAGVVWKSGPFLRDVLLTRGLTDTTRAELAAWARETSRDGVTTGEEKAALAQAISNARLRPEDAEAFLSDYREAIEKSAESVREGACLVKQGNFRGASERFLVATEHDPWNVEAWVNLGAARLEVNEPSKAEDALRRALELDQGRWTTHYNLGATLAVAGNSDLALRHLERSLSLAEAAGLSEAEKRSVRQDLASNRRLDSLRHHARFEALLQHQALERPAI